MPRVTSSAILPSLARREDCLVPKMCRKGATLEFGYTLYRSSLIGQAGQNSTAGNYAWLLEATDYLG